MDVNTRESLRAEFRKQQLNELQNIQESFASLVGDEALPALALAPYWPLELAKKSLPISGDVKSTLEQAVEVVSQRVDAAPDRSFPLLSSDDLVGQQASIDRQRHDLTLDITVLPVEQHGQALYEILVEHAVDLSAQLRAGQQLPVSLGFVVLANGFDQVHRLADPGQQLRQNLKATGLRRGLDSE